MAKDSSSQKFIGKNNAPRVQIEYDVELYGSQKKVELPFVTGVMSDLSGHRKKPLLPIEERKFLTFDQDNFNDRMRAIKPRLQFYVENTLSEDDALLDVELEFESMEDFFARRHRQTGSADATPAGGPRTSHGTDHVYGWQIQRGRGGEESAGEARFFCIVW